MQNVNVLCDSIYMELQERGNRSDEERVSGC